MQPIGLIQRPTTPTDANRRRSASVGVHWRKRRQLTPIGVNRRRFVARPRSTSLVVAGCR
eukprot:227870-Lingulodinium_polyedra.AAC.1